MLTSILFFSIVVAVFILLWRAVNVKTAIVGLAFVLGAFLMWRIGDLLFFFWGFSWLGEYIGSSYGIHPGAAKAIAVPFVAFLIITGKMAFSLQARRRTEGFYLFFSGIFLYYLMAYVLTAQYNFDPKTGKALVNVYTDNAGDLKKSFGKRVDPITGQPTKPMTAKHFQEIERDEKDPEFEKISFSENLEFFDRGGNSRYWYGKNVRGDIELFNKNGHHPQTSMPLQPVTPEVVKSLLLPSEEGQGSMEKDGLEIVLVQEPISPPVEVTSELEEYSGSFTEESVIEEDLEIEVDLTTDPNNYRRGDRLKILASDLKTVRPE